MIVSTFPSKKPARIIRREPGPQTGSAGDHLQDSEGRWWTIDYGPQICSTTGVQRRAIIKDGCVYEVPSWTNV